jgi:thiamine transport system substrate-binding protein
VKNPPNKFDDLTKKEFKNQFALQDPRSSSPGLQFYQWVKSVKKDGAKAFLKALQPNVASVSPSWGMSYGLFQSKQAKYVFTYVTSLAYHWGVEKNRGYKIASFPEGHPIQIEYAGVPEGCVQCELAQKFVQFLTEPVAQKILMEKNFMFPVLPSVVAGTIFAELPQLKVRIVKGEKDMSVWNEVFK